VSSSKTSEPWNRCETVIVQICIANLAYNLFVDVICCRNSK